MPQTAADAHKAPARPESAEDAGLFRLLVERVVDYAVFLLTTDGHIWSWNAGAERLKGYRADEIIGQHFDRFYTNEDRAAGRPGQLLAAAREDGRVEDEGWRVRKDGSCFWADVIITALYDQDGVLRGFAKITRDLTDRRAADDGLRQSEQRFRVLVDSVKDYAIFMLSTDGTVLSWNQGAQRLKGYTPQEIIGQSFELFYPDDARAAERPMHLLELARVEGRVEDEGWRIRKDGSQFWADVVITSLRDDAGHLMGFAKVTRDLTERRQAEQDRVARIATARAAQRMERLQVATAALAAAARPEGAAEVLRDVAMRDVGALVGVVGFPTAGNEALEVVGLGCDDPTTPGQTQLLSIDEPHPLSYAWRMNRAVFLESRAQVEAEHPELTTMLQSTLDQAWAAIPLTVEDRVVGVLGVSFDGPRVLDPDDRGFLLALAEVGAQSIERARLYVGEQLARTEAESAARSAREEAQLVETLHRISLAVSGELDLDTVVQAVTDAATSVTGAEFGSFFYNATDERGERYTLYTLSGISREAFDGFPMPRNTAVFEPTFRGEHVVRSDDIRQDPRYGHSPPYFGMPAGHLPVRSYLAVPVMSRSGEVLGGLFFGHQQAAIFTERSERLAVGIAAQAAVAIDNARLYQQVQQAVRTRDEFLAAAAHDLKTPLASTKGIAQLLSKRISRMQIPDSQRLTDGLERINQSVERMTALIDELLDLARLQMDRPLDLERQAVDLAALVRQVVTDQEPNAPRHKFRIVSGAKPVVGEWDLVRLRRVLENLVSNAVKYSPEGGEVVLRIEQATRDNKDIAVLDVTDHGIGIPSADLPYVFERFRRGGNVAFVHGTGIGLGIAQSIVEQHGGSISVESVEGKGSTFSVRLPLD
jgi:PAS domain S-box-containing protein